MRSCLAALRRLWLALTARRRDQRQRLHEAERRAAEAATRAQQMAADVTRKTAVRRQAQVVGRARGPDITAP